MNKLQTLGLASLLVPSFAFAAVPEAVTDAIEAAGVDAGVIGASVLVVLIGIWAFKLLRRAK